MPAQKYFSDSERRTARLKQKSEWRRLNADKIKISNEKAYAKNTYAETRSLYYQKNREKLKAYSQAWRKANPDKLKEQYRSRDHEEQKRVTARWRTANPEYERNRYNSDPVFKITLKLRSRIRMALKEAKVGTRKADKTIKLLGCSFAELLPYIEAKFTPGMTREHFMRGEIHLDHIKPCAAFDLSDPEQQRICFHYTNLQPLWAADNLAKGAKYIGS